MKSVMKYLALGVVVMGLVHIAATFSPIIAGKLTPLNEGMQNACIYFSLMCGVALIMGGSLTCLLINKLSEYRFVRNAILLILGFLILNGILAVGFMPHNPCSWIIAALPIVQLILMLQKSKS